MWLSLGKLILTALKNPKVLITAVVIGIVLIMTLSIVYYRWENRRLSDALKASQKLSDAQIETIKVQRNNLLQIKSHEERISKIAVDSGKIVERIERYYEVPVPQECKNVCEKNEEFKGIYDSIADRFNGVQ
jgi:hypothetical protein